LKALSGENKGESKLVSSTGIALVLGRWTFFYNFKRPASWILKNLFCRHLNPNCHVLSYITNNMAQVTEKTFFCAIQDNVPVKLFLKIIQRLNTEHWPLINTLRFAGPYLLFNSLHNICFKTKRILKKEIFASFSFDSLQNTVSVLVRAHILIRVHVHPCF
jgi:hypothetical protein